MKKNKKLEKNNVMEIYNKKVLPYLDDLEYIRRQKIIENQQYKDKYRIPIIIGVLVSSLITFLIFLDASGGSL